MQSSLKNHYINPIVFNISTIKPLTTKFLDITVNVKAMPARI